MAILNEPLLINGLRLRNRLALPPITTNYAAADGTATDATVAFHRLRSRHVGLVIVEAAAVRADGRITPYSLGIWSDAHLPGLARLAGAIKAEGAAAFIQINHAGARSQPFADGLRGASPSGFAFRPEVEPTVLDQAQIDGIVADFVAAAERAARAGFDGVEIHGAHFYLICQFLSSLTNAREDRYGGDAAARATFGVEVTRAVRARLGRHFPLTVRLNAYEAVEGGQTAAEGLVAARAFAAAGIDAIHVSAIAHGSWQEVDGRRYLRSTSALQPTHARGHNVPFAVQIKAATGLPVIAVGKLGGVEALDSALAAGVDVVALGRQLIADPDAAGKLLAGRDDEMLFCKECMGCFASVVGKQSTLKCSLNRYPAGFPVTK